MKRGVDLKRAIKEAVDLKRMRGVIKEEVDLLRMKRGEDRFVEEQLTMSKML